ncbi:hypothetical protein IAE35_13570 [Pseudomonas sp. S75]|uniref:hypothetical protein n=1 Tax=unclassified Pseudomonas TaxID=196821 RepID=UPI0019071477|nr:MULTISPECIES: hypothetical protein [unclassified Pseudomonas]MBJ9976556.1 hypothetical protein [Pseudomonas sp. S30]MBK0154372.1 hypothetical protein [Pseudomonas sp. S75]
MYEDDDLPEPEHDHLLDHEFFHGEDELEADAQGIEDDIDSEDLDLAEDDLDEDDDSHPAWYDDPQD